MRCIEILETTYHREPVGVVLCPYRVYTIGTYSDHQYGDKGIYIAYKPKWDSEAGLNS